MHESNVAVQQAGAFITCVVDRDPEPVYEGYHFQVEDCAAAVENMLLAVTALGLATVWIDGWLRVEGRAERIGKLIGLSEDKRIRVLLPIGTPAEVCQQKEKLPFEQRAWFNRYGG
jgi:nitroreductase